MFSWGRQSSSEWPLGQLWGPGLAVLAPWQMSVSSLSFPPEVLTHEEFVALGPRGHRTQSLAKWGGERGECLPGSENRLMFPICKQDKAHSHMRVLALV